MFNKSEYNTFTDNAQPTIDYCVVFIKTHTLKGRNGIESHYKTTLLIYLWNYTCHHMKLRTLTKFLQVQPYRHNIFVSGKSYADEFRLIMIICDHIFSPPKKLIYYLLQTKYCGGIFSCSYFLERKKVQKYWFPWCFTRIDMHLFHLISF